jgi:hypothetical protein
MPRKRESKKSLKKRQRKEKKNRKDGKSMTKKSSAKKTRKQNSRKQNSRNNRFIALPEYSIAFSNIEPNHNPNPNIQKHYSASSSSFMSVNRDGDSHYRSKQMETDGKTTKIKTDIDGKVSEKVIKHNNYPHRVPQSLFFMDTRPMILSRRLYF